MRSTILTFIFLPWCILDFGVVVALLTGVSEPGKSSSSPSSSSPTPMPLLPSLCGRRKVLAKTLSGVFATAVISSAAKATAIVPAVVAASSTTLAPQVLSPSTKKDANDNLLLSLESAAKLVVDGDNDSFADRLLYYPHPGLRRTASPVTSFGSDLETVADRLVKSMETDATTAVQYGIDARIIVLKGKSSPPNGNNNVNDNPPRPPGSSNGSPIVFVNPNVLSRSSEDKMVQWREYCLVVGKDVDADALKGESLIAANPNATTSSRRAGSKLEVDLLRDEIVEVAAQDLTGKPIRVALNGEASRAFQHELDHLDGILVIDHASPEELPQSVAALEAPFHAARQKKAFARATYQGNVPLYW